MSGGQRPPRQGGGGASDSSGTGAYSGVYRALSVAELKHLLNDRGVDHCDCLEKRHLDERLMSTRGLAPPSSVSYSDDGGGLSCKENHVVNTFTEASPAVASLTCLDSTEKVSGMAPYSSSFLAIACACPEVGGGVIFILSQFQTFAT